MIIYDLFPGDLFYYEEMDTLNDSTILFVRMIISLGNPYEKPAYLRTNVETGNVTFVQTSISDNELRRLNVVKLNE